MQKLLRRNRVGDPVHLRAKRLHPRRHLVGKLHLAVRPPVIRHVVRGNTEKLLRGNRLHRRTGLRRWKALYARNVRSELVPQRPEVYAELPCGHRHSESGRNKAVGERQRVAALFVDHGTALVHRHKKVFLCFLQRSAILVQRRQRLFQVREAASDPNGVPLAIDHSIFRLRGHIRVEFLEKACVDVGFDLLQIGARGGNIMDQTGQILIVLVAAVLVQQPFDLPQLRCPLIGVLRAEHAVDPANEPAFPHIGAVHGDDIVALAVESRQHIPSEDRGAERPAADLVGGKCSCVGVETPTFPEVVFKIVIAAPRAAGLIQLRRIEQADAVTEKSYLVHRHHAARMEQPEHPARVFRAPVLRDVHFPDVIRKGSHKPVLPHFLPAYHGAGEQSLEP